MDKVMEIKQHLEKIEKLEQTLPVFEESDELYLDVLHKIQGEFDEISDLSLAACLEFTDRIRETGSSSIKKRIEKIPKMVNEAVKEQIEELKDELKGDNTYEK
ncbi:hypothetical protein FKN04_23275 [Bacillus glycinifermentans]|uniref:hypothetical protein n=1 Tax=Bacillus TaxID=1386 RepID=UPI00158230C8|nr:MULTISPECIES: hypothetical protein [Bacillus]NUJ19456.1 hypothetical protein [Bacillus glycinifermentans]GIN68465.1 hypothetical protein J41TS2_38860 [Bacillus sonorensis]